MKGRLLNSNHWHLLSAYYMPGLQCVCKNCMCVTAPFNRCHSSGSTINSFTLQSVELKFRGAKKNKKKLVRQPAWRRGEIRTLACVTHPTPLSTFHQQWRLDHGLCKQLPSERRRWPRGLLPGFGRDDGQAGCGLSRVVRPQRGWCGGEGGLVREQACDFFTSERRLSSPEPPSPKHKAAGHSLHHSGLPRTRCTKDAAPSTSGTASLASGGARAAP